MCFDFYFTRDNKVKLRNIFTYLTLPALFLSFSCSGTGRIDFTKNPPMFFPSPPDTARIQFLNKISHSKDITGEKSSFAKYVVGEDKSLPINKPYGLTVHKNKLYICDTRLPGIEIIDLKNKTFEYFQPIGRGVLKKPVNCALDENGNLYVADVERKQVVIFNMDLHYRGEISGEEIVKPTDVSIKDDQIWICDVARHRISVFDRSELKYLRSFPEETEKSEAYLYSPTNFHISGNKVYVTDTGDAKVKIYSLNGQYLDQFGGFGRQISKFVRPKGISVDNEGLVYVADAAFENVQMFDNENNLLMFFGGKYERPGNMWLPAGVAIDYNNVDQFKKYVYPGFALKYLIFVANQYGPDRISIYGFVEQYR